MRRRFPLVIVLLAILAVPGLLLAHGALKRSEPAANTTLTIAPRVIRLTFTEPAELAVGRIELTGPNGQSIALSPVRHGDSVTVMIADIVSGLMAGKYTVAWQVAGRDGHPVRGTFAFTIAEGATGLALLPDTPKAVPSAKGPRPIEQQTHDTHEIPEVGAFDAESPVFAAIRWLGFAGLLGLVGTAGFTHLLVPGAVRRQAAEGWARGAGRAARKAGLAAIAVLAIALLLRLAAQTVAVHGSLGAFDPQLLTGTLWGKAWLLQLLALAAAVAGLMPEGSTAFGRALFLMATLAVAVTFAMSGHAAALPENAMLAIPIDTMHILGAGGWIGTLLLVVIVGIPVAMRGDPGDRGKTVATVINTFSPLALIFAGVAALTGIASAWLQLGAVNALWTTRYGQVLLVKLGLVLLVVATGAYNSWRVRPTLSDESGGTRIRRSATVELVIAGLVLAVTAVLVATPTAASLE